MKAERARCPVCGRDVATYVPAKGDGSQRNAYRHLPDGPVETDDDGVWCAGSHMEIPAVSYGNPVTREDNARA